MASWGLELAIKEEVECVVLAYVLEIYLLGLKCLLAKVYAYGTCNSNNLLFCCCVEGFTPKDNRAWDSQEWWSSGCVRKSPLNRDTKKGSTDEFIEPGVILSDGSASSYFTPTKEDCQKACLHNCSCTAFAFNSPSGTCQVWSGDLLNMHNSESCKKQAAAQISEGNMRYIVDEIVALVEETDIEEMKRAIVIGLLCIEGEEEMRPSMEQVLRMLEGKMDPQTPQMLSCEVKDRQANR
ncbi:hypothetical protein SUGI_0543740 [Cryptomeria japonica]|nr:hypothetical protein SUGI_0543740 [Cryptomeria japonica]